MREDQAHWGSVVSATVFIALIAGICAYAVHVACFEPPPPIVRPDPGTPRGEYCAFVDPKAPWVSLTLGPTLLMTLVGLVLRKHRRLLISATLLLALALVANAVVSNNLTSALTI